MKKLVILACVISVMAIIAISAASALAGGIVNNPAVCGPLSGVGSGPAKPVYDALCVN